MNRQIQDLETEIATTLQSLADELDRLPPLGEATVERVKTAVRQEINEQWLAAQPPILPSCEVINRLHASVRDELDRQPAIAEHQPAGVTASRWAGREQLFAGLATAAMIAICIGLIQHMGLWTATQKNVIVTIAATQQPIDLFVEAAEVALTADETTTALSSLSESRTGASTDGVLEDLSDAVQEILNGLEQEDNTMIRPTAGQGVFV